MEVAFCQRCAGLGEGFSTCWRRRLLLAKSRQSLPCHVWNNQKEKRWIWAGCDLYFFHTNVFNYPEKASQRQRGKALGYSGCVRYLPCSCRSSLCSRLIAFPRSSSSCTDSSHAQMDKTFLEHLRQEHPFSPPKNASSQMCQPWAGEGSCRRGEKPMLGGGICYQMTLPPCAKKREGMLFLPTATFTSFPTQQSIFVGRKDHKIHSQKEEIKQPKQPTIKTPFPYGRTASF